MRKLRRCVSVRYYYFWQARLSNQLQILDDYAKKMRDAENESHEGKRKSESLWPIMRISHTRSRYIYELYYKREAISKELYDWLLKEGYADAKYASSPDSHLQVRLTRAFVSAWLQSGRRVGTRSCAVYDASRPGYVSILL